MHNIDAALAQEIALFSATHGQSMALSQASAPHFLYSAPMHWMSDWATPHLIHARSAQDHRLWDVDGHAYLDLCLGDTGAMFGHRPLAIERVLRQSDAPLTCMLPSDNLATVGDALQARFGLSHWQVTLSASDANRFLIRWARAITQRPVVLVFDGCYHGAVDDTLVDWSAQTGVQPRASLLGEVYSHAIHTRVVPFNDLDALEVALASHDVACVLAEPALTNCGLVLPQADFWIKAQQCCQQHETLLILDETHTLSTGLGGYAQQHQLKPDAVVMGKAVAGGWPCGVYGFSADMAAAMMDAKAHAPAGHSGIGTTLSGNALSLHALEAALNHLHQAEPYGAMLATANQLAQGLSDLLAQHRLPWTLTQLGARMELQFSADPPKNAGEARAAQNDKLEHFLHLFMLNRGVLLTPFHNMMLCAPSWTTNELQQVLNLWDHALKQVKSMSAS